jgi:hypothetical protein
MRLPQATQRGLLVLQIRAIIKFALRAGIMVKYIDLAESLGLFSGGKQLAVALHTIMEEDYELKNPLTTCIILGPFGLPVDGFFIKAKELGYEFENNEIFWEQQIKQLTKS